MSASDEVAALPGGQALAALAAQVQGSPAAIRELASSWAGAAGDTATHTASVAAAVTKVAQTWQGSSATAFADLMAQFGKASSASQQSLSAGAKTLGQVADELQQVQAEIESIRQNLLDQVAQIRAATPGAAPADLDSQISVLVADATAHAGACVTVFDEALGQADAALSTELPQLGVTFSALPQPGNPGFSGATGPGVTGGSGSGPVTLAAVNGGNSGGGSGGSGAAGVPAMAGAAAASVASGGVSGWIAQAVSVLAANGVPAGQLNTSDIALIIQHESGGDPGAVNTTDYNAAAGTPSTGLMQVIQPTFNAYALPGHGDLTNPVDNIIAGVRYALATYGSLDNVPGVVAVHNGQPYVGY